MAKWILLTAGCICILLAGATESGDMQAALMMVAGVTFVSAIVVVISDSYKDFMN